MKKLILMLSFVILAVSAFAQEKVGIKPWNYKPKSQFTTQSLAVNTSTEKVSVLYLNDGLSNNFTALSYPLFQVTGLGNKVGIYAIGAASLNNQTTNVYAGTALGVNLVRTAGWDLTVYGGLKGVNLTDGLSFRTGAGAFVFGVGLSVPIR